MAKRPMDAQVPPAQGGTTTTTVPSPPTTVPPSGIPAVPGGTVAGTTPFTLDTVERFAGGVTEGYVPPKASSFADPTKPYLYTNQDWQILLTGSVTDTISWQRQLMKAFPKFTPGRIGDKTDPKTIEYFKQALGRINLTEGARGKPIDQALAYLAANPVAETPTRAPSYRLTNPVDLEQVFNKAAQNTIGRKVSRQQIQSMISAFNQQELQYQQRVSAGGTVVAPPEASTFAQKKIEKIAPEEANAQKYSDYLSVLSQMLGA